MKKLLLWGVFAALCLWANVTGAQCMIDKSNWTVVFSEDFNGTVQDLSNNWYFEYSYGNVHAPGSSWYETYNTPANLSVSGGYAYINTQKLSSPISYGGYNYDYSSCILRSKYADYQICDDGSDNDKSGFLYGMFEIRCKLPGKTGQFPAFWLTGNNAWPPEIDAFEFNGKDHDYLFSSVHYPYGGSTQGTTNFYKYPSDLTTDFHTYTVVWTPTKITWFFEGRELKSDNISSHLPGNAQTSNFEKCKWSKMDMIIQNSLNDPNGSETSFDPLIIDYVRVYKPTSLTAYSGGDFDSYYDNTIFPTYAGTVYKSSQDWLFNRVVVNSGSYNAYSSMNVLQNGGKFYYKGDYNLLWTTYWYDYGSGGQYYATPLDWYHTIDGPISLASPDVNTEIPFFKKSTGIQYYQGGSFYDISIYGTSYYEEINYSNPALFADQNGLQVLYLGNDNNLYLVYRNSLSTHTWYRTQLTTTGDVTSEIALAPGWFGNAFYRNTNNELVSIFFSDSWAFANVISSVSDVYGSIAVSPSGSKVFYKTAYGEMYYYYIGSGGWTRAAFTAVYPWSSGQAWQVYNVAKNIQVGETADQVYYIGTDNRVWVLYEDGSNTWQATAIHWIVDNAARDLTITNASASTRRLSFVGTDNQIRIFNYDVCENLNPPANSVKLQKIKPPGMQVKPETGLLSSPPAGLSIWPNPVNRKLYFDAQTFMGENSVILIFDSKGQKVFQNARTINTKNETVDLPVIAKGVYYMQVISTKHSATGKFLKME